MMLARFILSIIAPKYGEDGSSVKIINADIGKTSQVSNTPLNVLYVEFQRLLDGNFKQALEEIKPETGDNLLKNMAK